MKSLTTITPTKESLALADEIAKDVPTIMHRHYHILYDIANTIEGHIVYLEIGCGQGRSAALLVQRPGVYVLTIDDGKHFDQRKSMGLISKHSVSDSSWAHMIGDSSSDETLSRVIDALEGTEVDILFVDADHTYKGVINDFINYSQFVKDGGYIVFDDYLDYKYSPQVKHAVDALNRDGFFDGYEVIGNLKNDLHAWSVLDNTYNTCFILRKWQKGSSK